MDIDYLREYAVLDGDRLDSIWVEIDRLRAENAELRGAMQAADERLLKAGECVGLILGCDTPAAMADEITRLRAKNAELQKLLDFAVAGRLAAPVGYGFFHNGKLVACSQHEAKIAIGLSPVECRPLYAAVDPETYDVKIKVNPK